jgi:hypothetical protein
MQSMELAQNSWRSRPRTPFVKKGEGPMTEKNSKRADRLQIMLTKQELVALDDWRFKARMPSRSAAVRELLRRGLLAEGYYSEANGDSSSHFGVIDR